MAAWVVVTYVAPGEAAWGVAARDSTNAQLQMGRQVYQDACLACHGPNGAGLPRSIVGFERPSSFPNFSDCRQSAPEYTRDWRATIANGGPARGFSQIMPAFGDALTRAQIDAVIAFLRSLCTDRSWPPGELNPPRAMLTEKAFPEDEAVLTSSVDANRTPGVANTFTYEWQFTPRNQLEVEVPVDIVRNNGAPAQSGLGDSVVGIKHVLFFSLDPNTATGSILSVQGEVSLPTGSKSRQLGTGQTALGAFVAYDLLLPARSFLQIQAGGDIPRHMAEGARSVYARMAVGSSFATGLGLGRLWSPMLEVVANRDLQGGAVTDFDVIPQFEVTLSARQHVSANLAYRIAVNDTAQRSSEIMLYVLWDWLDGGLLEGW